MDYSPTCELGIPGRQPHGPGFFLVASNGHVEAGPFAGMEAAVAAARWLHDNDRGVNPGPWRPVYSRMGLVVGSRYRDRRATPVDQPSTATYTVNAHPTIV